MDKLRHYERRVSKMLGGAVVLEDASNRICHNSAGLGIYMVTCSSRLAEEFQDLQRFKEFRRYPVKNCSEMVVCTPNVQHGNNGDWSLC